MGSQALVSTSAGRRRNAIAEHSEEIAEQHAFLRERHPCLGRTLAISRASVGRKDLSPRRSTHEWIAGKLDWGHGSPPCCSFAENSRLQDKKEFRGNH